MNGSRFDVLDFGPLSDPGRSAEDDPRLPAASAARPDEQPSSLVPISRGNPGLAVPLSSDLDDENAVPYFLWDDPMTVGEVRERLAAASPPERDRLLGKILREARDPDVWRFTSPAEVAARFSALSRYLGRRRPFWEFLLNRWHKEGLLEQQPA